MVTTLLIQELATKEEDVEAERARDAGCARRGPIGADDAPHGSAPRGKDARRYRRLWLPRRSHLLNVGAADPLSFDGKR